VYEKNKIGEKVESKVPFLVKMATHKFDYLFPNFSATFFLVNFFEGQVHLQFSSIETAKV